MLALLLGLLLPALAQQARVHNITTLCTSNLSEQGRGMQSYTHDYANRFPTFSWTATNAPAAPGTPGFGESIINDTTAAEWQALNIIHRRMPEHWFMNASGLWLPYISYGNLVLADYLGAPLISPRNLCPMDANRLRWQREYRLFHDGTPTQPSPWINGADVPYNTRWPFSSSFEVAMSTWGPTGGPFAVSQATTHRTYNAPSTYNVRANRRISEVVYPSSKVWMYDMEARHTTERPYFFAEETASNPLLFFDMSVRVRIAGDANRGFNPSTPQGTAWTVITYTPELWEAPRRDGTYNSSPSDTYRGRYRFTRNGIRGRDFDGPEVPWDGT